MKKRGKGICVTIHSTGLTGGNDPSEATVRLQADGSVIVNIGSTELGQGIKNVARQVAAESLEIDPDKIMVVNADTDATPFCTGQFASRTSFVCGNAVKRAAEDLKRNLLMYVAARYSVLPEDLKYADGKIICTKPEVKELSFAELAGEAAFAAQEVMVGVGRYNPQFEPRDNETGKADFFEALQYISCIAEVEVDTVTGEVTVLDMVMALEMGKAINPMLLEGQMHGGASFGLGYALMEDVLPKYPDIKFMRTNFRDYHIPTSLDMPSEIKTFICENPSPKGPFGAKGCGEIVANCGGPAIANAIMDAIGVKFFDFPITPEKIIRALSEKEKKGA